MKIHSEVMETGETDENYYPRIMTNEHDIVLFHSDGAGIVVGHYSVDADFPVGYYSGLWVMPRFRDYKGVVIMGGSEYE